MGKQEQLKQYANAIFQNAMVGKQSCSDILPKIENRELKEEVDLEYQKFDEICDAVELFAKSHKMGIDDNNIFEKSRLWLSINMGTLFDKSVRHLTELLLIGTTMGLTTCYKDRNDHKGVNTELDHIISDLEETLESNYDRLKVFLKNYSETQTT